MAGTGASAAAVPDEGGGLRARLLVGRTQECGHVGLPEVSLTSTGWRSLVA